MDKPFEQVLAALVDDLPGRTGCTPECIGPEIMKSLGLALREWLALAHW